MNKTLLLKSGVVLFVGLLWGVAHAGDTVDLGSAVPTPAAIKAGLFPNDECEQLKSAGFKCMGFKPAVKYSLPALAFKVGSAELPEQVKAQLNAFAEVLKDRKGADNKVRIEGHADASGDADINLALSQRRAEAAVQYLTAKGVDKDLLVAVGLGSKEPANPANPFAAENRRVVIGRDAPAQ